MTVAAVQRSLRRCLGDIERRQDEREERAASMTAAAAAVEMAQTSGASGETLIRAIVAGYDSSTRIDVAVNQAHYSFSHACVQSAGRHYARCQPWFGGRLPHVLKGREEKSAG